MGHNKRRRRVEADGKRPAEGSAKGPHHGEPSSAWARTVQNALKGAAATAVGIAGIIGAIYGYKAYRLQEESEAKKVGKIFYAASVVVDSGGPSAWEIGINIGNSGAGQVSTLLVDYYCPRAAFMRQCDPAMVAKPATASVEIIPRSTPGHYQFVLKELSPSDGAMFLVRYASKENLREAFLGYVRDQPESDEFARRYVGHMSFSGENLVLENLGMIRGVVAGDP